MYAIPSDRIESCFSAKHPAMTDCEAVSESNRCLFCYNAPCVQACPTSINIPQFITRIADGNNIGSAYTILESNIMGLSCAKSCPVEELCVGACVYQHDSQEPVAIGRLQAYAMENFYQKGGTLPLKKANRVAKVALIGAGPASLSCAGYLALAGVKPVVFEKNDLPGGLNTNGIAPYKMKVEEALAEVEFIQSLGVEIRTGMEVGKDITVQSLSDDYDAIFIGVGLGGDKFLFPGTKTQGIYGATELIAAIKLGTSDVLAGVKNVVIIGGGNTAIDIAHELAVLGRCNITLAYRRTKKEMRGYQHELKLAQSWGVVFRENMHPLAAEMDNNNHIDRVRFKTGDNTEIELPADMLINAVGQEKIRLSDLFVGIEIEEGQRVKVDDQYATSLSGVFAGGDCVNGGKEIVNAVQHGKKAALAILKKLGMEVGFGRFSD